MRVLEVLTGEVAVVRCHEPILGAIRRMRRALRELVIVGVPTSQPFHLAVLHDGAFVSGQYDIGYLERSLAGLVSKGPGEHDLETIAIAAALAEDAARGSATAPVKAANGEPDVSPWLRSARLHGLR